MAGALKISHDRATRQPSIISVAICTYDRYDLLPKAVDSAIHQSLTADRFRIFVIDNSPDHAQAHLFGKRFAGVPNLTYIVEQTPGLSNARNVAARVCDSPFIAFMDDDAIAGPTWLAEMIDAFDAFGPSAMVIGGQVTPIWPAPPPPWLSAPLLGNLSVVNWGGERRVAASGEWFAGTNISFRTDAILANGGFAANLGRVGSGASLLSNEELQLVERIGTAGGQLIYAPGAIVAHLVDPARLTRSWFRKRSAWQAVSDFTMDPERMTQYAGTYWSAMLDYFGALPPHDRTIRGLALETDDPAMFQRQVDAIYMMTAAALAGALGADSA